MSNQDKRLAYAREILAGVEGKMGLSHAYESDLESGLLLQPGSLYHADSALGHVLSVLGKSVSSSQWLAVVGIADMGWVAAEKYGIPLDRVVFIPDFYGYEEVIADQVISVVDYCLWDAGTLRAQQRQRIAARVRQNRSILVTRQAWLGITRPLPVDVSVDRYSAVFSLGRAQ